MSKYSTLAFVGFGLLLLGPACSKSDTYYLLVDVSLETGVQTPDSVTLVATQNRATVKQATVSWSLAKAGVLEVGLALPSDTAIPVVVTGSAYLDGQLVGQGTATQSKIIQGQNNGPISLVIKTLPVTGGDGGVLDSAADGPGSGDVPVGDGPGGDQAGAESLAAGRVDGASDDQSTPRSGDGGPGADAGVNDGTDDSGPDAPAADKDSPLALDTAIDGGSVADGAPRDAWGADAAGRQWSVPLTVPNRAGSPTPSVAVSPVTGDAVVAWYDSAIGIRAVHYAAASDTWGASPATLESRGTPLSVQAAVDGTGRYVVVWAQNDLTTPSLLGVWVSYSPDGVTWSNPPVLLGAGPSNADYGDVRVAVNRAGQGWVVWDQTITGSMSSSDPETIYAVFLSGTMAKTPVIVKSGTTNGSARERFPRVAIDSQGHGLAAWTEADPNPAVGNDSSWGAALADGTTPSPLLLESYDADVTFGSDVAMNPDGQGVVIWAERRSSGAYTVADVFARRYSLSQGWEPEPPLLYAANYSGNLAVDEDRHGTVSIGFSEPRTADNYQAIFSTQAVGGTWSTASLESDDLAPGYTSTDIEPQVRAAFTSGDVLMAWRKRVDGSTFAPHFRWRSNGTWGVESEVGRIDNLYASELHIGAADDGRAVAAWTYYHCYYDSSHPDKCSDAPLASLPASTKAAIANLFVAVFK